MAFDVEAARKAGYTDAEIAAGLAERASFDLKGAKSAGYSDSEVIAMLSASAKPVAIIPGQEAAMAERAKAAATPKAKPSLAEQAVGTGEAALSAITGGTIGMLGGAVGAAAGAINNARGLPDSADAGFARGSQEYTYAPRTEEGQRQAQAVGDFANDVVLPAAMAIPGLGPAVGALGATLRGVAGPAGAVLTKAATAAPAALRELPSKIANAIPGAAERPTSGTMGSAGAAGTDMAAQRVAAAEQLPVPIKLTKGQASRDFEQMRFEKEVAKDPVRGDPLRERMADQTDAMHSNFDRFVDATGAEAPDLVSGNRAVVAALTKSAARDKAEIRSAYKAAEKAGEMAAPVKLDSLVGYLNEAAPEAATAPLLSTARQLALKLGIAEERGGQLVPANSSPAPFSTLMNDRPQVGVTLKTAETMRQAINRNTDFEPTNIRQATILKGLIDQATEGQGGDIYRAARALRSRYADKYENHAVIADLIGNRKGMADPKVAIDKVFQRSVLQGSPDDVLTLRRTLHQGGEDGRQAWREVQGATLNHIRDMATRGVTTNERGVKVISPAGLDAAVSALDKNGRLTIIFGKQGAQQLRDMSDIAKVINTAPPGAVNTSNTASVLLAALTEAGVTGSMTGIPVPVISGLRAVAMHVKDRRIQQRVQQALNNEAARQRKLAPNNKRNAPPVQEPGETIH